ncbi:MAG: beta-1,6-N-acetylglucosaminyltransferase [Pseudomonadota bacterium]
MDAGVDTLQGLAAVGRTGSYVLGELGLIGVVLLAHEQPRRTAQLARHLAQEGCRVVIHVDARATEAQMEALTGLVGAEPNVLFAPRLKCEWGTFSLVEASLGCIRLLLERFPDIRHICQLSGACLPIKPIADLHTHLERHANVDFIEAVSVENDAWVVDGLSMERFTLYHPLAFRKHRRLFDRSVALQRALRIKRQMPEGLVPHIGSQWWCLSRRTLDLILQDPRLPEYCAYFRTTWIPDESFFQTLAVRHSDRITSAPLTFVRFDPQGKPYVFYDDHLDLLLHAEGFFARKIWRGAQRLYETFLDPNLAARMPEFADETRLLRRFDRAKRRHQHGRSGLVCHGRHPGRQLRDQRFETARTYTVVDGLDAVFPHLMEALATKPSVVAHGALFAPQRVEFAGDVSVFSGNLTDSAPIRDRKPTQFLSKLIWAERQKLQVFTHRFDGNAVIDLALLSDPNAHVLRLRDMWLLDLFHKWQIDPVMTRAALPEAASAARRVDARFAAPATKAHVMTVGLGDLLNGGLETANRMSKFLPSEIRDQSMFSTIAIPAGFNAFLRDLKVSVDSYGLEYLADAVETHNRINRFLRRKT